MAATTVSIHFHCGAVSSVGCVRSGRIIVKQLIFQASMRGRRYFHRLTLFQAATQPIRLVNAQQRVLQYVTPDAAARDTC